MIKNVDHFDIKLEFLGTSKNIFFPSKLQIEFNIFILSLCLKVFWFASSQELWPITPAQLT